MHGTANVEVFDLHGFGEEVLVEVCSATVGDTRCLLEYVQHVRGIEVLTHEL